MSIAPVLTDELEAIISEHAEKVCKADELNRDDWLKYRKPFIGGSEAAAAMGLSPYQSQFSLYVNKVTDEVSDEDNDYMKWGRRLEEAIGLGISEDTGIPVVRYPYMLKSKKWPWMAVNLDFLAPDAVVEVKNVSGHMSDEWAEGAVPTVYGLQGQHACAVTGLPRVHFFPLIGGHEGRPVTVERNDALIENLVEGERKFWELVQNATPPEIDGSESTKKALKALYSDPEADSKTELPFHALELLGQRAIAKAVIKEHTEVVNEVENQLFNMMGNFEIGQVDGVTVMTWKRVPSTVVETYTRDAHRRIHVPKAKKTKK